MGCLNVVISRVGEAPNLQVSRIGGVIAKVSSITEPLKVAASLAVEPFKVLASNIKKRLNISCSVVCSLADLFYLNVSPEDVQWITDDIGIVYEVESNVKWIVVTE